MLSLVVAVASTFTAPLVDEKPLFSLEDVPANELKLGVVHRVGAAILVRPDGKARKCWTYRRSGNRALDAYTCRLIMQRARFRPATGPNDAPMYGIHRLSTHWVVAEKAFPIPPSGDLQLDVKSLPRGISSPAIANIMFMVDAGGRASNCTAHPTNKYAELAVVACHYTGQISAIVAKDDRGRPVPSVQNATMVFVAKPQPGK